MGSPVVYFALFFRNDVKYLNLFSSFIRDLIG